MCKLFLLMLQMAEKENLKSHMRAHSTSRERSTTAGTALQSANQAPEYFSVQVVNSRQKHHFFLFTDCSFVLAVRWLSV